MTRNHITKITMLGTSVKASENVEEKAVAEAVNAPKDPEAQKKAVQDNTKGYVDGNGSGVAHMAKGSGKEAIPEAPKAETKDKK